MYWGTALSTIPPAEEGTYNDGLAKSQSGGGVNGISYHLDHCIHQKLKSRKSEGTSSGRTACRVKKDTKKQLRLQTVGKTEGRRWDYGSF